METVHVELPAALIEAAKLEPPNVSREAAKLLALELFREEKVSLALAAELCGTPLESFMDFAAEHGVPPLRYGVEDLQEDRRSFKELGMFLLILLYASVIVPVEVHGEVVVPGTQLPGSTQIAQAAWLDVRRLANPEALSEAAAQFPLARGELATILLAEELKADLVLLDERAGRRLAATRGLRTRGCVGILEAAFHLRSHR